jgi:hypothetical protein
LNDIVVQFGILGQGSDMEGWVDLLVILVMAVLWAIGGLVKAGRSKAAQRREREGPAKLPQREPRASWQERLARKAVEIQRAAEAKGKEMAQRFEQEVGRREQGGRPSRPAGRITIRPGQRGEPIMVYEKPRTQPAPERQPQAARQRQAKEAGAAAQQSQPIETMTVTELREIAPMAGELTEPPKPLAPSQARPAKPSEPTGFDPAAIIDYHDPDALKKAILHYEILGKPVALRGSSERMPAL